MAKWGLELLGSLGMLLYCFKLQASNGKKAFKSSLYSLSKHKKVYGLDVNDKIYKWIAQFPLPLITNWCEFKTDSQ